VVVSRHRERIIVGDLLFLFAAVGTACGIYLSTRKAGRTIVIAATVAVLVQQEFYPEKFIMLTAIPSWLIAAGIAAISVWILRFYINRRSKETGE
jgi:hypothetical protein